MNPPTLHRMSGSLSTASARMMSLSIVCLTAFLAQAEGSLPESTIHFLERTDIEARLTSDESSPKPALSGLLQTALTDLAGLNETRFPELEKGLEHWNVYRKALESIARETRTIAQDAVRRRLIDLGGDPGKARVDPWNTVNQETQYFPIIETVPAPQRQLSFNVDAHSPARFIPPLFRLAELLEAGTNSVHCEPIFINPSIVFDSPARYVVNNNVRHQFIGAFRLNPGRQRIETFQLYLDSRLKVPSGFVNIGEGVKLKHYQVGDIPFNAGYNYHHRRIPWTAERMNRKLASEGRRVLPSALESQRQQPLIEALEADLERRLKSLKSQCLQSIRAGLNGRPEWSPIQSNAAALGGLLSEFHRRQGGACLMRPAHPSVSNLEDWLSCLENRSPLNGGIALAPSQDWDFLFHLMLDAMEPGQRSTGLQLLQRHERMKQKLLEKRHAPEGRDL